MIYLAGSTSNSVDIMIVDDTGLAVTGLVAATFPTLTYSLAGANADVAFPSLSDLATITTAYASGGVKERGNGYYRLDVPNGAFSTGGVATVRGEASGKHVLCERLHVVAYNPQDAAALGLSRLDAAVSSRMATYTQPNGFLAEDFAELDADIEAIQIGVAAIPTNPYTGTPPTAATIATAVLTSTAPGDLGTHGSLGFIVASQLGGAFTSATSSVFTTAALANGPGGGNVTVGGYASGQDPATLVLDTPASGHNTTGTIGQKINAAGGAADPLTNPVPGSYAGGTAGAALGRIGSGQILTTSPVAQNGDVGPIYAGDDYKAADGRQLDFTDSSASWPDLTAATSLVMRVQTALQTYQTFAGSFVVRGGSSQKVRIELSASQTASLVPIPARVAPIPVNVFYRHYIVAILADGSSVTLATGIFTFQQR